MDRWDETRRALVDWLDSSGSSEGLAAQVIAGDGFVDIDPSHPHGGPDGGGDADAKKDGVQFVLAVYFPRDRKSFAEVKRKFLTDARSERASAVNGFVFVTNQELTLSERGKLRQLTLPRTVELYHLERVTGVLDRPQMASVREQFLGLTSTREAVREEIRSALNDATRRLEGIQTGGDTFCKLMLYDFDVEENIARNVCIIRRGEFPLFDLRFRIIDLDTGAVIQAETSWGEISAPAEFQIVRWALRESQYMRVLFHARNGQWHQDLQLRKSTAQSCWLAATRIIGTDGRIVLEDHVDDGYEGEFGTPEWRG